MIGGASGSALLASSELFDPGTSQFHPGPTMESKRSDHSAVVIHDGRVLVVGGGDGSGGVLGSAELYGP